MNLGETKYSRILLLFALASTTTTTTTLAVFLPLDTHEVDIVTYSSGYEHVLEEGKHLGAATAAESDDNNNNNNNNTLWSSYNQTGRTDPTMTMLGQEENKDQLKQGPVDLPTMDQLQKMAAACRANPTWWDDNDNDNKDRQGDVRVNFEICNAVTGAHQWNHKVDYTDDYVELKKIYGDLDDLEIHDDDDDDDYDDDDYDDDDHDDDDDDYDDDDDDDDVEKIVREKRDEVLKQSQWWIGNKTDVQMQNCLRNKHTEISPICVAAGGKRANEDTPPFCTAHYAHRTEGT